MAPRGVCGQLTDEFGFGRLSDIYQIIVNHQAVGAALQADWLHQIKSLLFVTNNFYVDTSTSRTSPPAEKQQHLLTSFLLCFTRSVRRIYSA